MLIFVYRLVSAYVDKVLDKHRYKTKYTKLHDKGLNFSSFVDHILQEYNESDCRKYYNVPCFTIDPHWRPLNSKCSYCDIPYDVIGRMETFEEDVRYILLKQSLTHIIPLFNSSIREHGNGG
jgi:hypothetical protein